MFSYILRRFMLMVPTLLGVVAVVFFVMAFAPGGFGAASLTPAGAQSADLDALRLQKRIERRYGLNLPKIVQFGRWLNQVSPVGFLMSSQVTFSKETHQAVAQQLSTLPLAAQPRSLTQAVEVALEMAAYLDIPAKQAAATLKQALAKPAQALGLFDTMDVGLDDYAHKHLQSRLTELLKEKDGLARAQNELIQQLAFEISGQSRVRFDRPAVKWPDLGQTMKGRDVGELLWERVPITLLLNAISIPLIYIVAIVSGLYAARHRGGAFDVGSGVVFVGLWSMPVIWTGILMLTYLANVQYLHWFPTTGLHSLMAGHMSFFPRWPTSGFERGWLLDFGWHLVLPVACLTYTGFAVMSKVMRGSILDALSADYVRTARAKGVSESVVLWRHVFRNALLPLITMVAGILPALFAGTVVVETIFSINGMGRLAVDAAFAKDRELVMATTLIAGVLGLLSELARDVCYAVADPRVSYD